MVNIEKTKKYYTSLKREDLCDCKYCENYYLQVKAEYPEIAEYLASFGIDIEKPLETSPLEPDENGVLEYCCCQYIVLGTCSDTYNHRIKNVTFCKAQSYPGTERASYDFSQPVEGTAVGALLYRSEKILYCGVAGLLCL